MDDLRQKQVPHELIFFSRANRSYTELEESWTSDSSEQSASPRGTRPTVISKFKAIGASLLLGLCWNLSAKLHTGLIFQWSADETQHHLLSSSFGGIFAYTLLGILFEPEDMITLPKALQTLVFYSSLADAIGASCIEQPGLETLYESVFQCLVGEMLLCAVVYGTSEAIEYLSDEKRSLFC